MTEKKSRKPDIQRIIFHICGAAALTGGLLLLWMLRNWPSLSMEELLYQLNAPTAGTRNGLILDGFTSSLIPAVIVIVVLWFVSRKLLKTEKPEKIYRWLVLILPGVFIIIVCVIVWNRLDVTTYLKNKSEGSIFLDEHYVDTASTKITFPKEKKNLIYIYLESMEITFTSEDVGGGFEQNVIPELTEIAFENETFSRTEGKLDGGYAMPGTTWTMGGMFAQTMGLPLQISIEKNSMDTQDSFFPTLTGLGDILEEQGYHQVLMIGSDATFGGRRLYFEEHGDYEIQDYLYAEEQGLIPDDYYVWWGYEDEKLFSFARDELLRLAEEEEPFNLTLLTVDTHADLGYTCELCGDEFGDDVYANVFACSSRQAASFVDWIMQQDFYEDTVIVLAGDHCTMNSYFCDDMREGYERRTYTTFINAAPVTEYTGTADRIYTTFDLFPTTLAALGATIDGNRLGLGTNLFSDTETLTEQYGAAYEEDELNKSSSLMSILGRHIKDYEDAFANINLDSYDESSGKLRLKVEDIVLYYDEETTEEPRSLLLYLTKNGKIETVKAKKQKDGSYLFETKLTAEEADQIKLQVTALGESYTEYSLLKYKGNIRFLYQEIEAYLRAVADLPDTAVLMAIKDEGTEHLTDARMSALRELGICSELQGQFRTSYYAVAENGAVREEMSMDTLTADGVLADGAVYQIRSGGYDAEQMTASVRIDGVEYSPDGRGFNIVVYDLAKHEVIDRKCFDTYEN